METCEAEGTNYSRQKSNHLPPKLQTGEFVICSAVCGMFAIPVA